jgi:hypothetical protein
LRAKLYTESAGFTFIEIHLDFMIFRIDPIYPFGTQFYAHSASDAPLPVDSKLRGNRKTERIRAPFAAKRAALKKYHRAYSIPIRISEVTKIEYNSFFLFTTTRKK